MQSIFRQFFTGGKIHFRSLSVTLGYYGPENTIDAVVYDSDGFSVHLDALKAHKFEYIQSGELIIRVYIF